MQSTTSERVGTNPSSPGTETMNSPGSLIRMVLAGVVDVVMTITVPPVADRTPRVAARLWTS